MNALDISVAFYIGGFPVRWYGIFYLFAFLACIVLAVVKLHYYKKVPWDPFFYFVFIGGPVSIFGGRIWDIITGSTVVNDIGEVFGVVDGNFVGISGLSIQGGVIFALIAAAIWFPLMLRRPVYMIRTPNGQVQRVSVWVYADVVVPIVLLGQVIGRWGNFFNYELYGPVAYPGNSFTSLEWLHTLMPGVWEHMHITETVTSSGAVISAFDPTLSPDNLRQPMFLYESFLNFVGVVTICVGLEFVKKMKAGTYTGCYFIWYGIVRISLEAFKTGYDTTPYFVVAGLFILVGGAVIFWGQYVNYRWLRNIKLFRLIRYGTWWTALWVWAGVRRLWDRRAPVPVAPVRRFKFAEFRKEDLWYCGR